MIEIYNFIYVVITSVNLQCAEASKMLSTLNIGFLEFEDVINNSIPH